LSAQELDLIFYTETDGEGFCSWQIDPVSHHYKARIEREMRDSESLNDIKRSLLGREDGNVQNGGASIRAMEIGRRWREMMNVHTIWEKAHREATFMDKLLSEAQHVFPTHGNRVRVPEQLTSEPLHWFRLLLVFRQIVAQIG
jgi:hypothetical protein